MSYLTNTEIKVYAPAAYSSGPDSSVSNEYSFVPTSTIIEDMKKVDWFPVSASQQRNRKAGKKEYGKHIVKFRHASCLTQLQAKGDRIPEIGIFNGHDGKTLVQAFGGIFEILCGNGCVIPDMLFQSVSLRHRHYKFPEIEKLLMNYVSSMPDINDQISEYKNIILSNDKQLEFAAKAEELRWGVGQQVDLISAVTRAKGLLSPRRAASAANDAWSVFQNIQENLMKGGIDTGRKSKGRRSRTVRTRKLTSVTEYLRVNRGLWDILSDLVRDR